MFSTDINEVLRFLPRRLAFPLSLLPRAVAASVTEVRLRLNAPLSLSLNGRNLFVDEHGKVCRIESALRADEDDLRATLAELTAYSMYAYDDTVRSGFIPIEGGARAGVCGEAVRTDGPRDRLPADLFDQHPHPALPARLRARPGRALQGPRALLGAGAFPAGGGQDDLPAQHRVSFGVGELPAAAPRRHRRRALRAVSARQNGRAHRLCAGYAEGRAGIELLTRSMSPEVIVCDELAESESAAVAETQNSGVCLIASAHAPDYAGADAAAVFEKALRQRDFRAVRAAARGGGVPL